MSQPGNLQGGDPINEGKGDRIIVEVDEDIRHLVPRFIENQQENVETIKTALTMGDFARIQILGHSMKGAGGGYGFDAVTDMGSVLEKAAKVENSIAISEELKRLEDYLARVEVVFVSME